MDCWRQTTCTKVDAILAAGEKEGKKTQTMPYTFSLASIPLALGSMPATQVPRISTKVTNWQGLEAVLRASWVSSHRQHGYEQSAQHDLEYDGLVAKDAARCT
jgi:hypothetical protein